MTDENKGGGLAGAMGFTTADPRIKPRDLDGSFLPNYQLIRERSRFIYECLRGELDITNVTPEKLQAARTRIREQCDKDEAPLSASEKGMVLQEVLDEVFGFGPLGPLLRDLKVEKICVNGLSNIYARVDGKFDRTNAFFHDANHLRSVIEKILQPLGLRADRSCPVVGAHLPNGSRVEIMVPPASIDGPTISIHCFSTKVVSLGMLVESECLSSPMAEQLKAYLKARKNIIISGLCGSGRTTLLNALSAHIDTRERIISIERPVELRMQHSHWVRLEACPAEVGHDNAYSVRALIKAAQKMSPDRIIVGQCDGAEGYEFLASLNNGRQGDIVNITARSPYDCLRRLETMIRLGDPGLPVDYARDLIAQNVQVIVQIERQQNGKFKVVEIAEVSGNDGEAVNLTTIHCDHREPAMELLEEPLHDFSQQLLHELSRDLLHDAAEDTFEIDEDASE